LNRSRFHGLWPGYFNARTGVALLLTLLVTGLLSASTLSFIRMANLEARVADNTYALTQAEILAQAGLRGAMALLSLDKKEYDDLTEPWADFNRFAAMASMLLEEGSFKGKIEDLSRRVNLNALLDKNGLVVLEKQNQVQRLFMLLELDPALMEPLLDWLDRDDDPRSNSSAEGLYYLSLERPYPCANGPLETLGQLTLLKDFTPAIVYGTEAQRGLAEVVAAFPDDSDNRGRININTADPLVLMSLHEGLTANLAQEIVEHRNTQPFRSLEEFRDRLRMDPQLFNDIFGLISVKSSHFLIQVEGLFRQARVVALGIVKRDDKGIALIYYKTG